MAELRAIRGRGGPEAQHTEQTDYFEIFIISEEDYNVNYTIPSFPVITVEFVRVKYEIIHEPDDEDLSSSAESALFDGFLKKPTNFTNYGSSKKRYKRRFLYACN